MIVKIITHIKHNHKNLKQWLWVVKKKHFPNIIFLKCFYNLIWKNSKNWTALSKIIFNYIYN